MADLWFPGAERLDGPARKTSGESFPKQGLVIHSMEGGWPGSRRVLFDVRPRADGSLPGSWHFSNLKDGRLFQHYPIDVIAWHARGGNTRYAGMECEGRAGEPLTELQIRNAVAVTRWMKRVCEWGDLSRARPEGNMVEHQEVGIEANYATACPSHRIPWAKIMVRAEKEDDMELLKQLEKNANFAAVLDKLGAIGLAGTKPTALELWWARAVLDAMEAD